MIVVIVHLTQSVGEKVLSRSNCTLEITLVALIDVGRLGQLRPALFSRDFALYKSKKQADHSQTFMN